MSTARTGRRTVAEQPTLLDAEDGTAVTYTEWFMGDHRGIAPPATRDPGDPGPAPLNSPSGLIRELRDVREAVLTLMNPDEWITRDDTFGVLLGLADDIGEAIDELLAIGWPALRKDGSVIWESDGSRPIAAAEVDALREAWARCGREGRRA